MLKCFDLDVKESLLTDRSVYADWVYLPCLDTYMHFDDTRSCSIIHTIQNVLLEKIEKDERFERWMGDILPDVINELNIWLPHICTSWNLDLNRAIIVPMIVWACEYWSFYPYHKKNNTRLLCQLTTKHFIAESKIPWGNFVPKINEHVSAKDNLETFTDMVCSNYHRKEQCFLLQLQGTKSGNNKSLRKHFITTGEKHMACFAYDPFVTCFQTRRKRKNVNRTLQLSISRENLENFGKPIHIVFALDYTSVREKNEPTSTYGQFVKIGLLSKEIIEPNLEIYAPENQKIFVTVWLSEGGGIVIKSRNEETTIPISDAKKVHRLYFSMENTLGCKMRLYPYNTTKEGYICFKYPNLCLSYNHTMIDDGKLYSKSSTDQNLDHYTTLDNIYGYHAGNLPYFTDISVSPGICDLYYLAMSSDGKLWGWVDKDSPPYQIPTSTEIKSITTGNEHSLLLGKNGKVWSFEHSDHIASMCLVEGLDGVRVQKISTGWHHNLALDSVGTLYVWNQDSKPLSLFNEKFTKISAGYDHSIALLHNGKIRMWSAYKQMYMDLEIPDKDESKCIDIFAGYKYSLVLMENGIVYYSSAPDYNKLCTFPISKEKKCKAIGPNIVISRIGERFCFQ